MATQKKSHRVGPAPTKKTPPHRFPAPGEFVIYSTPLFLVLRDGQQELVEFDASMRVRIGASRKAANGTRSVDVEMIEWEAVGKSRLLDGEVRYTLLRGLKSKVSGLTTAADLPGRMELSGQFALSLNGKTVNEHKGSARGVISTFPPAAGDLFNLAGNVVTVGNVRIAGVACACPAVERFRDILK